MNYSRRNFVKLGGIAAIASLGLPNLTFGQKAKDFFAVQTTESLQQFIGAEFYIASDDVSTVVTLTAVKDFPHKTKTGKCFSMEFQVFLKSIKDDSYRVWNSELGNFELFMTAAKSGKIVTLNATINLL